MSQKPHFLAHDLFHFRLKNGSENILSGLKNWSPAMLTEIKINSDQDGNGIIQLTVPPEAAMKIVEVIRGYSGQNHENRISLILLDILFVTV